jgi:transcriptional regulator of acetoin/glycerol metabolism
MDSGDQSSAAPSAPIKQLLPLFTHTVTVPALRHRIDDLEELVSLLLREITRGADVELAPEAMRQLSRLQWPGNVSQLRRGSDRNRCPPTIGHYHRRRVATGVPLHHAAQAHPNGSLERDAIVRSLQDNGGSKQEAARALGMSRATIYRKIDDYGIA